MATDGIMQQTFNIEREDRSNTNSYIGEIGGGLQKRAEIEANACLISAAPEAIEFISDLLSQNSYMMDEVQIERAEAILKRAYNF